MGPPPDSDLTGVPVALGVGAAIFTVIATFLFIGWIGLVVLIALLLAALTISYLVVTGSETRR